ncbi:MAG: hypothetical protein NZ828_05070 [Alphaproteobacteria bacterium]|nr:hypothetical protein [Alphaproteobacteria bacterium]MCS5596606.1 hypothetical protein [Alphaproteobacteria bacterium]|tara:strand:+ start:1802 stop:2188 length:387 start_codon:yes stop_codon:yes gene_type:complete
MVLWGLYLSIFWAVSFYSVFQDMAKPERRLSLIESTITSLVITFSVFGLYHAPTGQSFAPFLFILLPLSAYFEISNAVSDLKSGRIQEQLEEDVPQDIINNIAFISLSAILLPGYIAGLMLIVKYGTL